MFFSFSFRIFVRESTVFLAKRLMDFVMTMSIFPAMQSSIMDWKSALFLVLVALFPSSAEIESRAYYGRKIEEILCRGGKQEYFNEKCFQKTVEKIMVFKKGTMDVHMKNGVVIQIKEDGGGKQ